MSARPTAVDIFAFLHEAIQADAGFLLRRSEVETRAGHVQFGMGDDLLPVVVVPLADDEADREDNRARGFQVKTATIPGSGTSGRGLMLKCMDARLMDAFVYLADDICTSLASAPERPSGTVCMEVLERWRLLFQLKGPDTLSQNAQVGLIAELHVLERALDVNVSAVRTWAGPESGRNDFLAEHASIEVKATLSRDVFSVGIHGIRQLETPQGGNPLYLYAEQLEPYPGGDSISSVAFRILNNVADRVGFLTKLSFIGIPLEELSRYDTTYRIIRQRLIPVEDHFPRITPATLRDVGFADHFTRVDYSIDIGALQSAVSDEDALMRVGALFA